MPNYNLPRKVVVGTCRVGQAWDPLQADGLEQQNPLLSCKSRRHHVPLPNLCRMEPLRLLRRNCGSVTLTGHHGRSPAVREALPYYNIALSLPMLTILPNRPCFYCKLLSVSRTLLILHIQHSHRVVPGTWIDPNPLDCHSAPVERAVL